MSVQAAHSPIFSAENASRPARTIDSLLAVLFGIGFTALLFAAIALSERLKAHRPPAEITDLAAVPIPLETPPPPPERESIPEPAAPAGLELPIPSAAAHSDAAALLPEFTLRPSSAETAMPTANIDLQLPANFRPHTELRADLQHVFQRYEVDKVATVISEMAPHVDRREMGQDVLHLNLIWVVEADGTVSNVTIGQSSGNPKIDALMVDTIKESIFAPAMKGGRRVRMMTSQAITLRWSHGELFH